MLKHMGSGITELEAMFQEQSNIDTTNAEEIYRKQGKDSKALDKLEDHPMVLLGKMLYNVPRVLSFPTVAPHQTPYPTADLHNPR